MGEDLCGLHSVRPSVPVAGSSPHRRHLQDTVAGCAPHCEHPVVAGGSPRNGSLHLSTAGGSPRRGLSSTLTAGGSPRQGSFQSIVAGSSPHCTSFSLSNAGGSPLREVVCHLAAGGSPHQVSLDSPAAGGSPRRGLAECKVETAGSSPRFCPTRCVPLTLSGGSPRGQGPNVVQQGTQTAETHGHSVQHKIDKSVCESCGQGILLCPHCNQRMRDISYYNKTHLQPWKSYPVENTDVTGAHGCFTRNPICPCPAVTAPCVLTSQLQRNVEFHGNPNLPCKVQPFNQKNSAEFCEHSPRNVNLPLSEKLLHDSRANVCNSLTFNGEPSLHRVATYAEVVSRQVPPQATCYLAKEAVPILPKGRSTHVMGPRRSHLMFSEENPPHHNRCCTFPLWLKNRQSQHSWILEPPTTSFRCLWLALLVCSFVPSMTR